MENIFDRRKFFLGAFYSAILIKPAISYGLVFQVAEEGSGEIGFNREIFVDKLDGNLISVSGKLVVTGGLRKSPVDVWVEFSTDRGFSQVVHRKFLKIGEDGFFVVNYSWRNPYVNSDVYVRILLASRKVSKKSMERRLIESQVKRVSPWD